MPARRRRSVDFPAPFAPTTPTTSPGATVRSSASKRVRWPYPPARPWATSVAVMVAVLVPVEVFLDDEGRLDRVRQRKEMAGTVDGLDARTFRSRRLQSVAANGWRGLVV